MNPAGFWDRVFFWVGVGVYVGALYAHLFWTAAVRSGAL